MQPRDLAPHLHAQLAHRDSTAARRTGTPAAAARSLGPSPRAAAVRPTVASAAGRAARRSRASAPPPSPARRSPPSTSSRSLSAKRHVVAHGHVRIQRVALKDHRDVAIVRRARRSPRGRRCSSSPALIDSSPATMRSVVLLPHPDGPTSTTNSPSFDLEIDAVHGDDVLARLADILSALPSSVTLAIAHSPIEMSRRLPLSRSISLGRRDVGVSDRRLAARRRRGAEHLAPLRAHAGAHRRTATPATSPAITTGATRTTSR